MELTPVAIIVSLSVIIIVLLVAVIYLQNKRIKDLQKPKYGFLGKPLSALVITGLLAGSVGFALFANQQDASTEQISADSELSVSISFVKESNRTYVFRAIPIIDGVSWSNDPTIAFDIFWNIEHDDEQIELIEQQVSQLDPSELTVQLDAGTNTVTARIATSQRVVEESITIEVD